MVVGEEVLLGSAACVVGVLFDVKYEEMRFKLFMPGSEGSILVVSVIVFAVAGGGCGEAG